MYENVAGIPVEYKMRALSPGGRYKDAIDLWWGRKVCDKGMPWTNKDIAGQMLISLDLMINAEERVDINESV